MLSPRVRWMMAAAALGLTALLSVAAYLQPSSNGQGTHQQLGLPPCSVQMFLGIRCPVCGMTTAWSNLMQGRLIGAVRANFTGTLLGILALLATPWLLACAIRGRYAGFTPQSDVMGSVALALMVLMLVEWGIRLAAG